MLVSLTTPVAPNTPFDEDMPWSYPKYTTFRELQQVFVDTAAYQSGRFKLTGSGEPEKISGEFAGASYFPILGVKPEFGRTFLPEDDTTPGTHPVAVVGHGLWQRRFGGDPAVVGRTVTLDGKSYILIGVAPAGFRGLTH